MPRKARNQSRVDPINEGVLRYVWDYFFKPLLYYRPNDVLFDDWFRFLFHTDQRSITQYRARADFRMPGLFYVTAMYKVQGIGGRDVREGQMLMVRKDTRDEFYDVEFFGGQGGRDQVFQLSNIEWYRIAPKLEEVPPRGMRKKAGFKRPKELVE